MRNPIPSTRTGSDRRSRGQALVEFALVAPLLLTLLIGIFEAGRFVLHLETLNHAAREGARYAIIHGSNSSCPSGPPPGGEVNNCDPSGAKVKDAVAEAASGLIAAGDVFVYDPVWWFRNDPKPSRGDVSTGNNFRGNHVTVFVDYEYDSIFGQIFSVDMLPAITISAESSLVVNN